MIKKKIKNKKRRKKREKKGIEIEIRANERVIPNQSS
jgi:hypothetical protein